MEKKVALYWVMKGLKYEAKHQKKYMAADIIEEWVEERLVWNSGR